MVENLKQQAYALIKEKILSCEYAPNSYLSEKIIINEIGMSRTPIRDALSRLEQEGLVEIHPKKGIWVSKLTFRDINNLFEFRKVVELYAVRNHTYKISKEVLQELYDKIACESGDKLECAYDTDDRFHDILITSTGNDYIIQAYALMRNQIHRLRILTGCCQSNGNRILNSKNEHIAILKALLAEDYEAAEHAMREHLTNSYNSAFALLTQDVSVDISTLTGK